MTQETIENEYFEWMEDLVCRRRYTRGVSYRKLLLYLHSVDFRWDIRRDSNRAKDGIDLRRRYVKWKGYNETVFPPSKPCSVLEMMVALAIRCEETIMDNARIGNRTAQWFWVMIHNLGISDMYDKRFDRQYVERAVERFLNHDYDADGKGGLFYIPGIDRDMRRTEIWVQLCWYLDNRRED